MDTEHQLHYLLQATGDEASCRCLEALGDASRNYRTSGTIPTDQLRGIYGVRAKINVRNGSPIAGFDGLMMGLNTCLASRLVIHSIGTPPEELFLAFTDVAVTQIVGILHIPPKSHQKHEHISAALATT